LIKVIAGGYAMRSSKLLLASIFITAVILVVIGGLTNIVVANNQASNQASNSTPSVDQQATVQAYQQRELAYQQLIQQANQQIEKANAQLKAVQEQNSQPPTPQPTAQPVAQNTIPVDQAAQIADKAAEPGQTELKKPELVSFEGKPAYEVVYEKGSIMVDAQSGAVLFNATVPQQITAQQAVKVATDYLKNTAVLQVDQVNIAKVAYYRVIFKDGTMVYLDLTGQITSIHSPAPVVSASNSGGGGGGGGSSQSHTEHEHEDGHDD
jgi:uncharacterized membrane protein YkoI